MFLRYTGRSRDRRPKFFYISTSNSISTIQFLTPITGLWSENFCRFFDGRPSANRCPARGTLKFLGLPVSPGQPREHLRFPWSPREPREHLRFPGSPRERRERLMNPREPTTATRSLISFIVRVLHFSTTVLCERKK